MYKSLITEYGIPWVVNRSLYSAKLKMMKTIPITERLFEKKVRIKRINIYQANSKKISTFLNSITEEEKNEIIMQAEDAVEGKIQGFSSILLDYGNPINWHLNPITKIEVDKELKWYCIPDFDPIRGDIKVVWEASRFTHFFFFIRAYMITRDDKFYCAFSQHMSDWLEQNQYSYGPNYKCGQEASLRMINALIAYAVFKEYGLTTARDEENLKNLVTNCYRKILSNFFYAHKCIKNNHTLSEITGLIIGAWCSEDDAALNKAYKLLDKEINEQFMNDGGYIQYSFNYQRFALQIIEFVLKISETTKIRLADQSIKLIEKSVLQMYQLQDVTGDLPNYGSNDGALIFPVTTSRYRDFKPVLNSLYSMIRGKKLYDFGNYDEEIFWFSDVDIYQIAPANIKRKSLSYKDSGLYSYRHDNGHLMIVLKDFIKRPAQMDQMHIDLWHKGVNVLCDSGTYSYATDIGEEMSRTAAHNTVKIDDKEQMNKRGPFFIYDWARVKDVEFNEKHFRGTMKSKNGYSHTRIIHKRPKGYFIEDYISENYEEFEVLLHTPCDVEVKEHGLNLKFNNTLIAKILTTNEIQVNQAYRSLYYLNKEKISQISIRSKFNEKSCVEIELVK